MGIQFEKLKKKIPTNRPILVKQGQVRGNKNIFQVGLSVVALSINSYDEHSLKLSLMFSYFVGVEKRK